MFEDSLEDLDTGEGHFMDDGGGGEAEQTLALHRTSESWELWKVY